MGSLKSDLSNQQQWKHAFYTMDTNLLPPSVLVDVFQHDRLPVGVVGDAAKVGQRLLGSTRLALGSGQQVA